ncbi:MAG: ATP-binding protein [Bacteroidota bacterium]|nr:ATP-binding protein [Bacteroidota bacterium]
MHSVTIDELRNVIAFKDLPDAHLQWILDRADYMEFEDGIPFVKFGDLIEVMWILLEGKVTFYMDANGRQVYYFTFENDIATGGVGGLMPYSRLKNSPGYSYASGKVRGLALHKKHFPELERLNPELIQKLIGYMTERARSFATTKLQYEKVNALGNLAAGIAHELNNPAAAINRISNELSKRVNNNYDLTEKLLNSNIGSEHIQNIKALVLKKEHEAEQKIKLTAMQHMEKEDEISDWLEKNNINDRQAAETFAEYGFSAVELDIIRKDVGAEVFVYVVPWLENLISSQRIIQDLADASNRISNLVGAIKSHVHMDRTNDKQLTNIHLDIENTLTLLGFKLRDKNIEVKKKFCADMPMVPAYVGELNQVWTNLIDNAIFAMPLNGELLIETSCDKKNVKVCVIDNGPGIPPEIISRIFDPFFTTKKVGEGTGIGLDLVSRIVKRHQGDLKVHSVPERTEFSVCIPLVESPEPK